MRYRRLMSNPAPGKKEAKRWLVAASVTLLVVLSWILLETSSSSGTKEEIDIQETESAITQNKIIRNNHVQVVDNNNNKQQQLGQSENVHGPMDMQGMRVMWEAPQDPKGLLFVAHGCKHSGTDFWEKDDEKCPECLGLPEEIGIRKIAVELGYVVIGISSQNRKTMCWHVDVFNPSDSQDVKGVKDVLEQLITENGWQSLPLYALGASSGGFLVLMLPSAIKLDGICAQISSIPSNVNVEEWSEKYPPTAFVHMPRDKRTLEGVQSSIEYLQSVGTTTLELQHHRLPLTQTFFSERIAEVSDDMSNKIYLVFKDNGLLDDEGYLNDNPRKSDWREHLSKEIPDLSDKLVSDESAISEALNVAYAQHEIVRDFTQEVLKWFEEQRSR
eukprot:TRINITY_DN9207_c0_g1_i2.p1 TRINITY_DN9207_c0_g1~~TRINITY_DN9207_c0_g1_i2.p1  ORF type:complete len:387 (-),score=41.11 TRINITY_DN9207_c0_g1_i2:409-1569(-)